MRETIIRRFANTELPADPSGQAQAAVEPRVLEAWFRLPLRPAAVLIPLVQRQDELHVLFTERRHDLPVHAGEISFPGGRVESVDRDLTDTALRESREEIGLEPAAVEIAGYMPPQAIISGFAAVPVIGFVPGDFEATPDPGEVETVFEVPLSFLMDPANANHRYRTREGVDFSMWEYHWEQHRIWGATGIMLHAFIDSIS